VKYVVGNSQLLSGASMKASMLHWGRKPFLTSVILGTASVAFVTICDLFKISH